MSQLKQTLWTWLRLHCRLRLISSPGTIQIRGFLQWRLVFAAFKLRASIYSRFPSSHRELSLSLKLYLSRVQPPLNAGSLAS